MTPLVPIMLFGWIPFSVIVFNFLKSHKAVLVCVIGGTLFLPQAKYSFAGFPDYNKQMAIAVALVLGSWLSGLRGMSEFQWKLYDLPFAVFCCSPLISSMLNGLGWYNGFSAMLSSIVFLGIPYLAGRRYFSSVDSLRDLAKAIVVGGLIYLPLCWYEVRMSPQLSRMFYGFFPSSFAQQYRYGGFRPVVFMAHGLMVAQWMAVCTVAAYWLWRGNKLQRIRGIPMWLVVALLMFTTVLCKSANGVFLMMTGLAGCTLFRIFRTRFLLLFLACVLLYPVARINGWISGDGITAISAHFVDQTREGSLGVRLKQEDFFVEQIMKRPMFGWGWMDRAWPKTEEGKKAIEMIDSYWLIIFAVKGFVGLYSFYFSLLGGVWIFCRRKFSDKAWKDDEILYGAALSIVVLLFGVDSLVNAMPLVVYFVGAGALVTVYGCNYKKEGRAG